MNLIDQANKWVKVRIEKLEAKTIYIMFWNNVVSLYLKIAQSSVLFARWKSMFYYNLKRHTFRKEKSNNLSINFRHAKLEIYKNQ